MTEKKEKDHLKDINKFWHPINIYNNLKALYFSIIPKGSQVYNITYSILRLGLKQFQIFNIYYREWIRRVDSYSDAEIATIKNRIDKLENKPIISVVMPVYNPPVQLLEQCIESVVKQVYPYWELCIADDASTDPRITQLLQHYAQADERIKVIFRQENGHISAASNTAMELAIHEFMALLDHDDLLHPLALYYVAQTILAHPDCQIIYTDEDKITRRGKRLDPYFKPDFDYELILSHNMVSHLGVYRLSTVRSVDGFREGLEGSQDYDLLLRVLEKTTPDQIVHIPYPLYHWRISSKSAAENVNKKPYAISAAQRALSEHHARMNVPAKITFLPEITAFHTEYPLPEDKPSVEIILPGFREEKTRNDYLASLCETINQRNVKISIIADNVDQPGTQLYVVNQQKYEGIHFQTIKGETGFVATLNQCISSSTADYLIIFNEHLMGFIQGWLSALLGQAMQQGIGAVSPKLYYPSGNIYFNGIILRNEPLFNFLYHQCPNSEAGYFGWAKVKRGFSTLTDLAFAVNRAHILSVNGFDERYHNPILSMADFFLKLKDTGLRNVILPSVELFLPKYTPKIDNRINNQFPEDDIQVFKQRWHKYLQNDPAFNPNLAIFTENRIIVNIVPELTLPGD